MEASIRRKPTKWFTLLNRYGISYMAWNLSNKNESSSLLKSSCKKTSGWSASDLSESGTYVVRQMKGKLSGGTGGTSNGSSSSGAASGTSSKAKSVKASKKYCTVSVKKDGSWKKGKRYYTLYRVTIRNKSKYNISGWKLPGQIQIFHQEERQVERRLYIQKELCHDPPGRME